MSDPATNAPYGSPLTSREIQVLRARDNADTDEEAAAKLEISVHTLRSHLANVRSRLGVRTTHRAIRIAVRKKAA
jgi:DNA-binding CsgD family transcriptional regulator